ncbi:hypothetical protein SANTM175S_06351 [Streptomyces antimycoticus]
MAALALVGGLLTAAASPAAARPEPAPARGTAQADASTWKNVRVDGGGFVPGIVFNRKEKNLAYARTDIGGAYRWDQSGKRWVPLLDSLDWDHWGWTGVVSLASDSVDPDKVYVAAGTYTNSWDPGNGAILRSSEPGRQLAVHHPPLQAGRQYARPRHGGTAGGRPPQEQRALPRRAERQRAVALHRLRGHLGPGGARRPSTTPPVTATSWAASSGITGRGCRGVRPQEPEGVLRLGG